MEELIINKMKLDKKLCETFTNDELAQFLNVLISNESDVKRQEKFEKLIKGEME